MSSVPSTRILTRYAGEKVKAEWALFVFFHRKRSRDGYLLVCFAIWTNSSKLSREQKTSIHPINVREWGIQVMLFMLRSTANCWCSFPTNHCQEMNSYATLARQTATQAGYARQSKDGGLVFVSAPLVTIPKRTFPMWLNVLNSIDWNRRRTMLSRAEPLEIMKGLMANSTHMAGPTRLMISVPHHCQQACIWVPVATPT